MPILLAVMIWSSKGGLKSPFEKKIYRRCFIFNIYKKSIAEPSRAQTDRPASSLLLRKVVEYEIEDFI